MDLQAKKLDLIKWIADLNEPSILAKFFDLRKENEQDWWNEISDEEKAEIEEGLAQEQKGELHPHHEVMARYQKWITK